MSACPDPSATEAARPSRGGTALALAFFSAAAVVAMVAEDPGPGRVPGAGPDLWTSLAQLTAPGQVGSSEALLALFSPLARLVPLEWLYRGLAAASLALSGLAMFAFVRIRTGSNLAALVLGTLYGSQGAAVGALAQGQFGRTAFFLMPLYAWALDRVLARASKERCLLLVCVVLLAWLATPAWQPILAAYTALALLEAWPGTRPREGEPRTRARAAWLPPAAGTAASLVVGALAAGLFLGGAAWFPDLLGQAPPGEAPPRGPDFVLLLLALPGLATSPSWAALAGLVLFSALAGAALPLHFVAAGAAGFCAALAAGPWLASLLEADRSARAALAALGLLAAGLAARALAWGPPPWLPSTPIAPAPLQARDARTLGPEVLELPWLPPWGGEAGDRAICLRSLAGAPPTILQARDWQALEEPLRELLLSQGALAPRPDQLPALEAWRASGVAGVAGVVVNTRIPWSGRTRDVPGVAAQVVREPFLELLEALAGPPEDLGDALLFDLLRRGPGRLDSAVGTILLARDAERSGQALEMSAHRPLVLPVGEDPARRLAFWAAPAEPIPSLEVVLESPSPAEPPRTRRAVRLEPGFWSRVALEPSLFGLQRFPPGSALRVWPADPPHRAMVQVMRPQVVTDCSGNSLEEEEP